VSAVDYQIRRGRKIVIVYVRMVGDDNNAVGAAQGLLVELDGGQHFVIEPELGDMGVVIAASMLGKLKTVSQIVCLVPLLIHYEFYGVDFQAIGMVLLAASFVLTIWSGVDYFISFFRNYRLSGD